MRTMFTIYWIVQALAIGLKIFGVLKLSWWLIFVPTIAFGALTFFCLIVIAIAWH